MMMMMTMMIMMMMNMKMMVMMMILMCNYYQLKNIPSFFKEKKYCKCKVAEYYKDDTEDDVVDNANND